MTIPPTTPSPTPPGEHEPEPRAIHALCAGLVDYAGLYPPAKLDMRTAVRKYAEYLRWPESWMLGRFVCPVSRLEEFRAASADLLPKALVPEGGTSNGREHATGGRGHGAATDAPILPAAVWDHADQPWPISALIDGDLDENLDSVFAFNREHSRPGVGYATIDAIEIRVPADNAAGFIDEALELIPEEVYPFFEIPLLPAGDGTPGTIPLPDIRGPVAALAGADAGAKVRTGGLTPDAFPAAERLAEFLIACQAADVPFKATAGLHHPVRAHFPLTYDPGSPVGPMHGFVNLFMAAALLREQSIDAIAVTRILEDTDPAHFQFSERLANWTAFALDTLQVAEARETFALSFGSCSFEEPVNELKKLGYL